MYILLFFEYDGKSDVEIFEQNEMDKMKDFINQHRFVITKIEVKGEL